MSRRRKSLVAASLVAASILLLRSGPSFAAGPDPVKGGVPSPLGTGAGKAAPAQALPAAPPTKSSTGQPAGTSGPPSEQKWPRNFTLGTGERTGFGFAVGKPGPIVVTVKWQGGALLVTLVKPGGVTVERQGSGSVTIEYAATADDVKKGVLWSVSLRSAQAEQAAPAQADGKRAYRELAKGTVNVQHPPGDMNLAQSELKAGAEKTGVAKSAQQPTAPQGEGTALKEAALRKQQAARQAQRLEQVKGKIPAEAYQKVSSEIASGANAVGPGAQKGAPVGAGGTASVGSAATKTPPPSLPFSRGPRTAVESIGDTIGPAVPGTSSTQSGQTGAAGSNPPATVVSPVITSLSVSDGQKGDPVLVTGTGFTNTPGEVRFANESNPQQDHPARVVYWNDREILVTVPDVSQVTGSNGVVYVRRANMPSNKVPFRFTEMRILDHATTDRYVATPYTAGVNVCHPACAYGFNLEYLTFGNSKNDEYYRNTTLRNGWVVDSAYLAHLDWQMVDGRLSPVELPGPSGTANANSYITDSRPGTSSPYVKVHWWYDAGGNSTGYLLRVVIRGPKNVPHQ